LEIEDRVEVVGGASVHGRTVAEGGSRREENVFNCGEVKKSSKAANGGRPALLRQVGEVGGAKNRYVILRLRSDLRNEDQLHGVLFYSRQIYTTTQ
jgi:hypothetical protein